MQLRRLTLAATGAALLAALPARADTEAASRVTFFREPSSDNRGISVIHPQVDARAALGSAVNLSAGYDVDIVSGATRAVFGPTSGVDAVSGATNFSDTRQAVRGALAFGRASASVTAGYSYGWESDYKTHAVSATTSSDLLDHNFTLALGYTHNFDSVCDANNAAVTGQALALQPLTSSEHCFDSTQTDVVSRRLNIDTFEPSLTWTVTPRLVAQGGGTIQILDGFQSNPYRSVLVGSQHRTPQERMPELRQRYALFGRLAYAMPDVRASAQATLRLYRDSWAVQAVTSELLLNKYLFKNVVVTARGRHHLQQAASFYRDAVGYRNLGPAGQYWTGDRELSPMSNYLVGGKLAFLRRPEQERGSWFVEMELNVKVELLLYRLQSDNAPNADRSYASIWQAAFALRF